MHLHPPEAFRDAEWWGKKMPIPHSEYFLSRIIQILPFTKIITTLPSSRKTILFHRRRKHGMGLLGKVMRKKRLTRRMPESSRKRKLGGNSRDHRPYFTYWVTFVQAAILFISLLLYGFGPLGVDLYKRSNMVSVYFLPSHHPSS